MPIARRVGPIRPAIILVVAMRTPQGLHSDILFTLALWKNSSTKVSRVRFGSLSTFSANATRPLMSAMPPLATQSVRRNETLLCAKRRHPRERWIGSLRTARDAHRTFDNMQRRVGIATLHIIPSLKIQSAPD